MGRSLSAREVAFLAEQEPIYILPRHSMNGIELIGPNLKKLKALQKTEVSLWLAVLLKKQGKCNIVIPDWLNVPNLKQKYKEEQKTKDRVSQMPWHWIPIAKILLDVCPDDFIDSPHELRSLIQDLREIRLLKTRQGFSNIDDEYLELTGLSLMEINEVRPFLLETMDTLRALRRVTMSDDEDEENQHEDNINDFENDNPLFDRNESYSYDQNNDTHESSRHSDINFSDPLGDSHIGNSSINTSATDATLVDAAVPATKRRRVDHRASRASNQRNNQDSDSDSDSDVEYRR